MESMSCESCLVSSAIGSETTEGVAEMIGEVFEDVGAAGGLTGVTPVEGTGVRADTEVVR